MRFTIDALWNNNTLLWVCTVGLVFTREWTTTNLSKYCPSLAKTNRNRILRNNFQIFTWDADYNSFTVLFEYISCNSAWGVNYFICIYFSRSTYRLSRPNKIRQSTLKCFIAYYSALLSLDIIHEQSSEIYMIFEHVFSRIWKSYVRLDARNWALIG